MALTLSNTSCKQTSLLLRLSLSRSQVSAVSSNRPQWTCRKNHPFYLGNRSALLLDDDQVEKFRKKYGGLTQIMEIPVLKGEITLPPKRKSGATKGGKKK